MESSDFHKEVIQGACHQWMVDPHRGVHDSEDVKPDVHSFVINLGVIEEIFLCFPDELRFSIKNFKI